jgi:hypothetical protein
MIFYTTVDEIVDPIDSVDVATATTAELNNEVELLSNDAADLEVLIDDLHDRLVDIRFRRDVVQNRLDELEDQQAVAVA